MANLPVECKGETDDLICRLKTGNEEEKGLVKDILYYNFIILIDLFTANKSDSEKYIW